ncbi:glycosyltransferase family 8 protein [Apiospora kogelbergensis]|uniref:glycosyltransferase family 8 protein n=1 Tax=Apiospora kogelbergensis TaxID=1337665 RepID=UPI00312FEB6B
MAERGISFDGADQGLLNMHFKNNCNRISFSYNVTPSAHYQYVPAYHHFQSSINMVHFIGPDKPWFQGRYASTGSGVFDEMMGRWWAVYDRHYRTEASKSDPSVQLVRYLTKGEYQPRGAQEPATSRWDAQRSFPPHYVKPKAIFPWEINQEAPTRVFAEDAYRQEAGSSSGHTGEPLAPSSSEGQTPAESSVTETSPTKPQEEPPTPISSTVSVPPSDPWSSFTRTNAWDEVPEIERYVGTLQKHTRSRSLKSPGIIGLPSQGGDALEGELVQRGSKLTDFPSEAERPSLPVTPAPMRRPKFWGGGGAPGTHEDEDEETLLPAAEGVPEQSDWDPVAQLQKLAKQQSEMLLHKLGSSEGASSSGRRDSSDLPARPVPFGSEELTSPTYVAQTAKVLSPQPVKGNTGSSMVRGIASDDEKTPRASAPESRSTAAPPLSSYRNLATPAREQLSRKARIYLSKRQLYHQARKNSMYCRLESSSNQPWR